MSWKRGIRKAITMEPQVHEILCERLDAVNALRGGKWNTRLTVPNLIELYCLHVTIPQQVAISFVPSTRKPGRQKVGKLLSMDGSTETSNSRR
jgi:hypothetical protein